MSDEHLTLEDRVTRLEHRQRELTYYVAQTRYAADCIFNFISNGVAPGIPWEDMGYHADEGDAPPAQPPSRAQRRQAARGMAKRMTNVEGE